MKWAPRIGSVAAVPALLLACVLGGCAANTAVEADAAPAGAAMSVTTVTVRNNHSQGRDMVIYLEPSGRDERRTLGTVAAGATATFNVESVRGYYTMIAAHNLGEVSSDRFNIPGPSTITWTLQPSRVVVSPK